MKKYIKHTLFIILLLGLVLLLFWKDITSTAFMLYSQTISANRAVLDSIPQPYELASSSLPITQTFTLGNIHIPIPFAVGEVKQGVTHLAVFGKHEESILLFDAFEFGDVFFEAQEPEEEDQVCDIISRNAPAKMCDSNYDFLAGILSTHVDDVTLFSSRQKKEAFGMTSYLKRKYSVPGEMREFSTEHIRGFWSLGTERELITFFDQQDKQYDLVISELDTEATEFILNNITSK